MIESDDDSVTPEFIGIDREKSEKAKSGVGSFEVILTRRKSWLLIRVSVPGGWFGLAWS